MSSLRPTFRVLKNGYDRFAVDDAIEKYAAQVQELQNRIQTYEQQLQVANQRIVDLQMQYKNLENSLAAEKQAAENIARLSLREANEIIDTAQQNADMIVKQALITAREILTELSKLYNNADAVKSETMIKLERLLKELDEFKLPRMPDLAWLKEAEKKMQ